MFLSSPSSTAASSACPAATSGVWASFRFLTASTTASRTVEQAAEQEFFLRPDVREERLHGDVGRVGDLGNGDVIEVPLAEQAPGGSDDRLTCQPLLSFPQ